MLGAKVYSQVGSQEAASIIQKGVLYGGVGEGDVLLGEARVPFSLLQEVPFHYLALRLQPPPQAPLPQSRQRISRGFRSGAISSPNLEAGSSRDDDMDVSCNTRWPSASGRVDRNIFVAGKVEGDAEERTAGLLGIGVRMVFPKPTMPHIPDASLSSSLSLSTSSDCGLEDSRTSRPFAGGRAEVGKGAAARSCVVVGYEILLSVYEAEALVSFSANARHFVDAHSCFLWYVLQGYL